MRRLSRLQTQSPTAHIVSVDYKSIPVYVNNRDRMTSTKALCEWLLKAGTKKIIILDNASTYEPLLGWYSSLPEGVEVIKGPNAGPWGFWDSHKHLTQTVPYVVTDSDCVPSECCPLDLVDRLFGLLRDNPGCGKVGPGLRLSSIPDISRDFITNGDGKGWEGEGVFWKRRHSVAAFYAPLDTTFSLYEAYSPWVPAGWQNLRMDHPYLVEHVPWLIQELTEEEKYYRDHVDNAWSHISWDSPLNSKLKKDSECSIHIYGSGKMELHTT
jgi:hypothetical protein